MAKGTGALRHTHQYEKIEGVWHCNGYDGCTHFIPKNMPNGPLHRKSICWNCEKEFVLTPDALQDDQPICDRCRTIREEGPKTPDDIDWNKYIADKMKQRALGEEDKPESEGNDD